MSSPQEIIANVRRLSGVGPGEGPDDAHLYGAVSGFVSAFDYWYIRVIRGAVGQYRKLIIARINPFVRRIEFDGLSAESVASKLVEDYNSRNFVTAGGWALEELAVSVNPQFQKSPAPGIDIQSFDVSTGDYHLYVLKSGLVTRNSDIMSALKRNGKSAEKLLRQGRGTSQVRLNYVIASGKTSSTFEDGVHRPSSAEFWSVAMQLGEDRAIELALAIAAEAGRLVRTDASEHIDALKLLVRDYISIRDESDIVDWEFVARRNMSVPSTWATEDKSRNARALQLLSESGYGAAATAVTEAVSEAPDEQEPESDMG